jgi:hypothetical protein
MPSFNFLPLAFGHSSRKTRKLPPGILRCASVRDGCSAARLRPVDRHRDRDGRGSETESKENYHGEHRHLHQERGWRFHRRNRHPQLPGQERPPHPRDQPGQRERPSHRAYVGRAEIGAAWPKRSAEQRDYLSVKLDDPSFNAPIYANLFNDEEGEPTLIWSRPQKARHVLRRLIDPLLDAPPRGGISRGLKPSLTARAERAGAACSRIRKPYAAVCAE